MILFSFKRLGATRHDDPNSMLSHRVGNEHQAIIDHTCDRKPRLSVILAPVLASDGERIVEDTTRSLEAYAMPAEVGCRLAVVPFEVVVPHIYGLAVFHKIVEAFVSNEGQVSVASKDALE
jgi:hypothetical protein